MRLSELTWPQAEKYFAAHDTVIIGVGSIECHGRHMPLGTDTIIPDFLLEQMEQRTDALICPTIPYGATEYLGDFPGTVNLALSFCIRYCLVCALSCTATAHGALSS